MNDGVLYGLDYLSYYFFYLYDEFVGFPLIIQISVGIVLLSLSIGIFLFFYLLFFFRRKRIERKTIEKLEKRFGKIIREIAQEEIVYPAEEIATRLNYDKRHPLKTREKRLLIRVLVLIKVELGEKINRGNYHSIVVAFDLPAFFEREIQFGKAKYKVRVLMWVRFLEESVSDAVLVRLLYNKHQLLRKAAQATFMWDSKTNPFRFFDDKDFEKDFQQWDRIDVHSIFKNRERLGWGVPNLLQWIESKNNQSLKKLFVSEICYLKQTEQCPFLLEMFASTDDMELREEITIVLGKLKYKEAEKMFMDTFSVQPEKVKQAILKAVSALASGRALTFLRDSYLNSMDVETRFVAIKSIYDYGIRGKRLFERLETRANKVDARMFAHIQDPLINYNRLDVAGAIPV